MPVPNSELDVIMDQTNEPHKTALHYTEGWDKFKTVQCSLSDAAMFYEGIVPDFKFQGPLSYYLDSPPSINTDSMTRQSSAASWIQDSDSSVASLSHGSSPSDCSSFNMTPLPEMRMERAKTGDFRMQEISTMVDDWEPWGPGSQNLIMREEFHSKAYSTDLFGVISDGTPNVVLMERTQSMLQGQPTNVAFSQLSQADCQRPLAMGSPEWYSTGSDESYLEQSPDSGYHSLPQSPNLHLQNTNPPLNLSIARGIALAPRKYRGRRRRTLEQSKHLEHWLETHGTVPGKEIQSILASESGLSVSQVKYYFKNELKSKASGVLPGADSKMDTSCLSTGSHIEEGHLKRLDNLQQAAAVENQSREMTEPDSDETDYSDNESPGPITRARARMNRYQPLQLQTTLGNLAPNSTDDYSAFMGRTSEHKSNNQSSASPSTTDSVPSPGSSDGDKTSSESSPNSSTVESPDGTNYSGSTSGSDASTPNAGSDRVGFEARKRAVVDRLLKMFLPLFNYFLLQQQRGGCQDQEQEESGSSSQSTQRSNGGSNTNKRGRQMSNTEKIDDDIDNGAAPSKKAKISGSKVLINSPLYACPYFKRNRTKYQRWRGCPGPGWDSVHRVKEHLYRNHMLPIHCPRCQQTFSSEPLLLEHHRAEIPCTASVVPPMEGLDALQERRLRSRKRDTEVKTEEDKWRKMYKICFEQDDESKMPSPYYDDNSPVQNLSYEDFLKQALPSVIRTELDNRVDALLENAEENLRSQLPDIFREVSIRLYQTYTQTRNEEKHPPLSGDSQNDSHVDVTDNGSSSVIETEPSSFDASITGPGQPSESWEAISPNFNESFYLSSMDSILSPPGAGVDALLTPDWSFCGLSGIDQLPPNEEQAMEES